MELGVDISKLRPRMANLEKERLYDDAMKLKIHMNRIRDENTKLKTRIHILETDSTRKERLIDELIHQQNTP